jgi:predicted amidohydrolase YtcJ
MRFLLSLTLCCLCSVSLAQGTRFTNAVIMGSAENAFVIQKGKRLPASAGASQVVDLKGQFVVFGLVDGHAHLHGLGTSLSMINLVGTPSWRAVVAKVLKEAPKSGWVIGRGWDHNDWKRTQLPTHHDLSHAFPNRPVVLTRVDGHVIVANLAAMKLAGIESDLADPPGGRIMRNGKGRLTGVFIDSAMALVRKAIPEHTLADHKAAIIAGAQHVLRLGLTGVHEMGIGPGIVAAYKELDAAGVLPIRIWAYLDGKFAGLSPHAGHNFNIVGVKFFSDGALGSRGAALLEPYSDEPTHRGLLQYDARELAKHTRLTSEAAFHIAIRAIHHHGTRGALDAMKHSPVAGRPHRIEHAQVLALQDFDRFVSQKVVASMQPTHCTSDMPWAEKRVGSQRILGAYAWRTMLNKGIPLVFGSDFPVESPDPRKGFYAALTRQDLQGQPSSGWYPEQRVTLPEAIHAFSAAAASVVGAPADRGDFTVFGLNLMGSTPQEILNARVLQVFVGGRLVYTAP